MNILVKVSKQRKCPVSLDLKDNHWVMSFGDLDNPDQDVEIEFTVAQLAELRGILNGMSLNEPEAILPVKPAVPTQATTQPHRGSC